MNKSGTIDRLQGTEIAVIGMACRFPGARNPEEFWRNLKNGVESISFGRGGEPPVTGGGEKDRPIFVSAGGRLEDIDLFDASFFGFTPREAEITDPQHRIFLECAWEAFENAGWDPERFGGLIGVYAGSTRSTYLLENLLTNMDPAAGMDSFQIGIGNDDDFLSTRVSYKLNLKGPSVNVQTACSTSLVAVHMACQSLLGRECDMALAGGVTVSVQKGEGYWYQEGGIFSPDGHCRAFDAEAMGMVGGNGAGIVVLKRLKDALADGDFIHAVIRGSAVNNDGSLKVGFTAPGVEGQAEVIAEAQALSGVAPETITYIEAHGTGTILGDPIEISALTQAFRASTGKKGFCAVGSVKTNIGHLDKAAGAAGLIKTVLAMEHGMIPPSLNFERPNPKIDFAGSPFYVNSKLAEWKSQGSPRRAGVSSFGMGGTNAHVVLEEAPPVGHPGRSRPWKLLLISARSHSALDAATDNLAGHLARHPDINMADAAYTLQVGRRAFGCRRMLVCRDPGEAASALKARDPKRVLEGGRKSGDIPVVFMFSGQGAQYVNMALEIYRDEPVFREQVDLCSEILESHLGFDLRSMIFPAGERPDDASGRPGRTAPARPDDASGRLGRTAVAQPALFVIEYAMSRLWMEWGIRPQAMIGHSIGEYVAACLSGVFSLEDALGLVSARGRLMQQQPGGSMLAVPLPEGKVRSLIGESLSLAAVNGPELCVVSGIPEAVEALNERLAGRGIECRRLHTSHAFHSRMMDPVLQPFTGLVRDTSRNEPRIPYISNFTGKWITPDEATSPEYWAGHLRGTVRFDEGLRLLLKEPDRILLEVGPGRTLSTLAARHSGRAAGQVVLSSIRHPEDRQPDAAFLMTTLGKLWLSGVGIDWTRFYSGERRRRVPLPVYPFERQRYWIEARQPLRDNIPSRVSTGKRPDIADWFYVPVWRQSAHPAVMKMKEPEHKGSCCLIFAGGCGLDSRLAQRLKGDGWEVTVVRRGDAFDNPDEGEFTLDPGRYDGYEALFDRLRALEKIPEAIIHLWNVTLDEGGDRGFEHIDRAQRLGFYSLVNLAGALGEHGIADGLRILSVSNHIQDVTGEGEIRPEKATSLGAVRVIPQEYPNLDCRSIDLVVPEPGSAAEDRLAGLLLAELDAGPSDRIVAYRGNRRWVQAFEQVRLEGAGMPAPRLREEGVYLITGGLGGIGLTLAEYLAGSVRARLVLTGRSAFPERGGWGRWLEANGERNVTGRKILKLMELEKMGAEVLVSAADVADLEEMEEVARRAHERFGGINGVIHAAGIAGGGTIQLKGSDTSAAEEIFAPKVRGTQVLDLIFRDAGLDFIVLCSSLRSIAGGAGQVDYCAANAFLDAYASRNDLRGGPFTVSIIWDAWKEVGMSVDAVGRFGLDPEEEIVEGISPGEGVEVFRRVMGGAMPRVAVSTRDLGMLIDYMNTPAASAHPPVTGEERKTRAGHPRPELGTPYIAPGSEAERILAGIWRNAIGIEKVGVHDNFFELGGDSVISLQIIARAREAGLQLTARQVFENQTIAELASVAGEAPVVGAQQGVVSGPVPLTPIQHLFFELDMPDIDLFSQSLLIDVDREIDAGRFEKAIGKLLMHHDALRSRFERSASGWRQYIVSPGNRVPFSMMDLSGLPADEREAAMDREISRRQESLDLAGGSILGAVLFDLGPGRRRKLLMVIHHLVIDVVSWRILMEDLGTALRQSGSGEEIELPPKTTPVKRWAESMTEYAGGKDIEGELDYWLDESRKDIGPLPVDFEGGVNTMASAETVSSSLTPEETHALLQEVPGAYRTRINDVLLTALGDTLSRWSGRPSVLVNLEGHGREALFDELDLSRTVGWFTSIYPVLLNLRYGAGWGEKLKSVKERLRSIPNGGIGYGVLRYLKGDEETAGRLGELPRAEVVFLYLGQYDRISAETSPFGPAVNIGVPNRVLKGNRMHLLEVNGLVIDGGLQMRWIYSGNVHRRETVEGLALDFMGSLRSIIAHCQSPDAGGYTPSDFPEADLSQEELDEIIDDLEGRDRSNE